MSFQPIGTKHNDVDQTFTCTARNLQWKKAVTLNELQNQPKLTLNEHTTVTATTSIANIPGPLVNMAFFNVSLPAFLHYRYFNFLKSSCNVKDHIAEELLTLSLRKKSLFYKDTAPTLNSSHSYTLSNSKSKSHQNISLWALQNQHLHQN